MTILQSQERSMIERRGLRRVRAMAWTSVVVSNIYNILTLGVCLHPGTPGPLEVFMMLSDLPFVIGSMLWACRPIESLVWVTGPFRRAKRLKSVRLALAWRTE